MAFKSKSTTLLILSIVLLSATAALSSHREEQERKRELQQCKQQCRDDQPHSEKGRIRECEQRCEERQERQREAERRLDECQDQCRERLDDEREQRQCRSQCEERYQKEIRSREEESDSSSKGGSDKEKEKRGEEGHPYVFHPDSFEDWVKTEHGRIRALDNFVERSDLFLGVANYRVVVLEANPNAYVMPSHVDADAVFYVIQGDGVLNIIHQEGRESHEIRQGDIIKVSAGNILYLINKSNDKKLIIVQLMQPISTPGRFEVFHTVGGDQPESYYQTFSNEVLAAALNAESEKIKRLFGQQSKGVIVEASKKQIEALSRHTSSERGRWPFGGESTKPFNLLNKRPTFSNDRGQMYEADRSDYQQLKDLNVQISFANITKGSMLAPSYNSRATKLALVVDGKNGRIEMVCPHESSRDQKRPGKQEQQRYQRIQSRVSAGTLILIPAGHPFTIIAPRDENIQVVCFEINAENNEKIFVTGQNAAVKQMESEAKELAFNVPSKLIDEVFNAQREKVFVRGPEESRRLPLESILDFAF